MARITKLQQFHKEERISADDFKRYYRPLKRSIKITPRSESLDKDLYIEMDVREKFSNNITRFCFNSYWGAVEPYENNFDLMYTELLDRYLKPIFWDIVEEEDNKNLNQVNI